MDQLSRYLMYLPGIIIFLVGSGQVKGWLRRRKPGTTTLADVVSCHHIVKKDARGKETYNYYNVMAEFTDPASHHKVRQTFKSPTKYAEGQQVRIYWGGKGEKTYLTDKETEAVLHPLVMMVGGALLILLALFENQGREIPAMGCLAAVLAGGGLSLILNYLSLKRRQLEPVEAEIVELYTRQISKETKILKGEKFTYYPVVKYTVDGRENIRRCNINSSGKGSFKVGETLTLYRDPADGTVIEGHARKGFLAAGIILTACGVLAGLSILSVVIR